MNIAMNLGMVAAIVYGILAIVGGGLGYRQAGSKISLISGVVTGLLLLVAGYLMATGVPAGRLLGLVISGLLVVVFTIRLFKTRRFMPAGLMVLAGVVTLLLLLLF